LITYKIKDFEQGIEVNTVSSYLEIIHKFQDKLKNDPNVGGLSQELFFRGQETEFWDLKPSIFRNDMIGIEHILMQEPLRQFPNEFNDRQDDFDILTKYQHYGMCTRLLDMTTNPLIALYFACKQHGSVVYETENGDTSNMEPSGVVYYKVAYKYYSESYEAKIISSLARMNIDEQPDILNIIEKIWKNGIITEEQYKKWITEDGIIEFIKIIQNNYMVSPLYSNERLIRQNGIFLLPGCYNVATGGKKIEAVVSKGYQDLHEEFEEQYIYIDGENKKKICEELDVYNINEAILFPELEHKLNYIRNKYEGRFSAYFTKFADVVIKQENTINIEKEQFDEEEFMNQLKSYLTNNNNEGIAEEIIQVIVENMIVDWYKKESIKGKMRKEILGIYINKGDDRDEKRNEVKEIVDEAVKIYSNITEK